MRAIRILLAGLLLALLAVSASAAPIITVNENGAGTLDFLAGPAIPLTGVMMADPGPGGLASALTYDLLGPPFLTPGDLWITEGPGLSDLIRFNSAGTAPGYPASLVFYSDLDGTDLADVGMPTAFYTNIFSLPEGADGTVDYTPGPGQPGYVPGFAVSYHIISDADANTVPEPGSMLLLGSGLVGLARIVRRRLA